MKIPSQHDTKTSPLGEMATSKIMPENRSSAIRRKLYFAPGFKQFAAHGVGSNCNCTKGFHLIFREGPQCNVRDIALRLTEVTKNYYIACTILKGRKLGAIILILEVDGIPFFTRDCADETGFRSSFGPQDDVCYNLLDPQVWATLTDEQYPTGHGFTRFELSFCGTNLCNGGSDPCRN